LENLRSHCEVCIYIKDNEDTRTVLESLVTTIRSTVHFPKENPATHNEFRPVSGWGPPGNLLTFASPNSTHRPIPSPKAQLEPAQYAFASPFDYEVTQNLALHFEQLVDDTERLAIRSASSGTWSATVHPSPQNDTLLLGIFSPDPTYTSVHSTRPSFPTEIMLSLTFSKNDFGLWSAIRTNQANIQTKDGKDYNAIVSIQLITSETNAIPKIGAVYDVEFHVPQNTTSKKHAATLRKFANLPDNPNQLPWLSMLHGVQVISKPQSYLHTQGTGMHHQYRRLWCEFLLSNCNPEQKNAFHAALNPTNCITLLEGPPGTGKSQIIAKVAVMLAAQGYDVLVCGSSNRQLDDLAQKCSDVRDSLVHIQEPDFLVTRIYPPAKEYSEMMDEDSLHNDGDDWASSLSQNLGRKRMVHVRDLTVTHHINQALQESPPPLQKLVELQERGAILHPSELEQVNALYLKLQKKVFTRSRILCATPETAIIDLVKGQKSRIRFIIIDESTQITEATALLPIVANSHSLKGLFLVGDPRQLPAIVRSIGKNPLSSQLQLSLFERLSHLGFPLYSLVTQYRMRTQIVCYPNSHTYQGSLRTQYAHSAYGQSWDRFCQVQRWPVGIVALYSNGSTAEKTISNSWFNPAHVESTVKLLRSISLMTTIPMEEITIITPYKAQAQYYADHILSQEDEGVFQGIRVTTVDAFQGRESGLVIFDLTITAANRDRQHQSQVKTGFMSNEARLNVALTRSKYGLIIIADRTMMKQVEQLSAVKAYSNYLKKEFLIRKLSFINPSTDQPSTIQGSSKSSNTKDPVIASLCPPLSQVGSPQPRPPTHPTTQNIPNPCTHTQSESVFIPPPAPAPVGPVPASTFDDLTLLSSDSAATNDTGRVTTSVAVADITAQEIPTPPSQEPLSTLAPEATTKSPSPLHSNTNDVPPTTRNHYLNHSMREPPAELSTTRIETAAVGSPLALDRLVDEKVPSPSS
jgi:hypothetical protein